jgi:hypothetical protein
VKKTYLLLYSSTLGTREEIKACLDAMPDLLWRYDMPSAFYLVSEKSAVELCTAIETCRGTGDKGRFLVAEVNLANTEGWITADSWYLFNNLKLKPQE